MNCACNSQITCNYCRISGKMRTNNQNTLVVDIDNTLTNGEYPYDLCTPNQKVIDKVNECYDKGWKIELFTARGMTTYDGNVLMCDSRYRTETEKWLEKYNVKYHALFFGKRSTRFYIDDKNLYIDDFLNKEF